MSRLRRVWRILSMRCDESVELLSQAQDEPLPFVDRLALNSHLLFCKPCRRMASQLRFISKALGQAMSRAEDTGERLSVKARARIQNVLGQTPES